MSPSFPTIMLTYRSGAAAILTGLFLLVGACDQTTTGKEALSLTELQGQFVMEGDVPEEALAYGESDYARLTEQYMSADSESVGPSSFTGLRAENVAELAEQIEARFPSFETIDANLFERVQQDMPELSRETISDNISIIEGIYEAQAAYLMHVGLIEMVNASSSATRFASSGGGGQDVYWGVISSKEARLLARNPILAPGWAKAVADAQLAAKGYGAKDGEKGNAFKHALWSALIATYASPFYKRISDCNDWANLMTDAHESGFPPSVDPRDNAMDYHNNREGRDYFKTIAVEGRLFVKTPSLRDIISGLQSG